MKIGLYGGMANNMYVFAKALSARGADVMFIRDRSDRYPMSQPVWEDVPFQLTHAQLAEAHGWTWEHWAAMERELGWSAPHWIYDPLRDEGGPVEATPAKPAAFPHSRFLRRYVNAPHRAPVLRRMQSCDVLLVCGVEGSVLAQQSGRPYVIWPHGGDTMIAAGMFAPRFWHPRARFAYAMLRRQLLRAYDEALSLGSHEPTGIQADYLGAEGFVRRQRVDFVPIPIPVKMRQAPERRRDQLAAVLTRCGANVPSARYVGFVPSRVDYQWKGHDRLLRALARLEKEGRGANLHLVFAGWGHDYGTAKRFVDETGLAQRITLLDVALSKPLLNQMFLAADFVVDQFIMGLYGTAALEAMACGAPLVMWVNDAYERPWGAPPVLQARNDEEVTAVLRGIAMADIDLEQRGAALQAWMQRVHSGEEAARSLDQIYARARK